MSSTEENESASALRSGNPASGPSDVQHTPGPWRVMVGKKDRIFVGCDFNGDEIVIAQAILMDKRGNARLIAAAPCLLEALEKIANADSNMSGCRDIARVAILKAKGE